MNALQRLIARMRAVWAAARGFEAGVATRLPPPPEPPVVSAAELVDEADRQGVADARATMQDSWSFGGPDDPLSEEWDPPFVRMLRHRREAAVATAGWYGDLTAWRLSHVRGWREESQTTMDQARRMMGDLAVREARQDVETVRRPRRGETRLDPVNADAQPDEAPWEGESVVLGWFWRMLILVGLVGAEFAIQYFVYDLYFSGTAWRGATTAITLSTAGILVIGPYVGGLLLRARRATGAERRIQWIVLALAAPWLYVAVVLSLLRSQFLGSGGLTPGSTTPQLHLAPLTVMIMFIALLLITGAMAFMLGLARRHPFQEAYVRQRALRNRLDVLHRSMADRINPSYQDPADAEGGTDQRERAIRESYAAAEFAYFAALVRTVGDPAFTEAVQQRRGLRPPQPVREAPPTADDPPSQGSAA